MASKAAIGIALAMMHELFPTREFTKNTPIVWMDMLQDVGDAELTAAVRVACNQPGRTFFPTPGELRAILSPPMQAVDTERVIRLIDKVGKYDPRIGWIAPRVDEVRLQLGDAVATAYGYVGPSRLFSGSETTREIARRDFAEQLVSEVREGRPLLLPPAQPVLALSPGSPA